MSATRNGKVKVRDDSRPIAHGPITIRTTGKPGTRTGWVFGLPAYWWRAVAFHAGLHVLTLRVEPGDDSHLIYSAFPGEERDLGPGQLSSTLSASEKEYRMWTPYSEELATFLREKWDYNEEESLKGRPIPSYGVVYPVPGAISTLGQLCAGHVILTSPAAGLRLIAEAHRHGA